MNADKLTDADIALLEAARRVIAQRFREGYHHVGAALRTKSGQVFSAVHLEAYVGRIAVCAEAIALGMAAATGDTEIDTIVAVNRDGEVVAPCGMCRELITDYAPGCRIIIPGADGPTATSAGDLLPEKYRR
ncbi:MAG TPA: cytidine deaminase [bacterium]|nr:cytidine deaminase [bacterium]